MNTVTLNNSMPLVEMKGITKRFGGMPVVDSLSFDLRRGEVHVLAGENGAGKSTLIKILAGAYTEYEGEIRINGKLGRLTSPLHANELGVAVIYQELSLIGSMSVADNIFLGRSISRGGFVDDRSQREKAQWYLARLGLDIDPRAPVEQFSIATQQCIEIAKALSRNAQAIVMDEPTSALDKADVERLFSLISQLKAEGCGIVYITHKMEEIDRIADRITVLRDGKLVGTRAAGELSQSELVRWMVGREIGEQFPPRQPRFGRPRLELRGFSIQPQTGTAIRNATFSVRSGEIVGIGGLQGSGASELLLGIFGALSGGASGEIQIDGCRTKVSSPRHAIDRGVALLTNDRKGTGLVLPLSIVANTVLASLKKLSWHGWRRVSAERRVARETCGELRLRAASLDLPVAALSGGNQQKVAIAKWLETKPRVLLLDEPTRGIDVGAKREIYALINRLLDEGLAILMITTEMPELLALSDRVIVMHRGEITAELTRDEATPEAVLTAAMGINRSVNERN
ncbi:MAG TPA: sugar ABC transporter ATP-binding protein [Lacipirellulaceae bacterium]|jgi:ABC-type sugar transport system ATPase subunit|nr:sugar ABC transporter ATP-binding protein [Lacipirellulaceae bacterium]